MSLTFYAAPRSSASPVASALFELDVPHERVTFDFAKKEQRSPEFLKLNPNGKVPTLVVDGVPMFEALAILIYLGDRYGVEQGMWPERGSAEHRTACAWATWAYVSYGRELSMLQFTASPMIDQKFHHAPLAQFSKQRLRDYLDILEERLSGQAYMLGQTYTLLDLIVASVVGYGVWVGASVEHHPHVQEWLRAFQARPAYEHGLR